MQIPILGVLRRHAEITIPDRHLGLIPTDEMADLDRLIDRLADLGDRSFDWSQLLPLLQTNQRNDSEPSAFPTPSVRIAIARDRAFSFYYPDNLDLLRQFGAELVPWSPLSDPDLPENISGLYFGGGFPEVFAAQLADNRSAMAAVKQAIRAGMPTYAECGGLMYLCQQIVDLEGRSHPTVGILPTTTVMDKRLTLGYRHAEVLRDSPLLAAGTTVWGHEFHRSRLDPEPSDPLFRLRSLSPQYSPTAEGWQDRQLHASYLHLHWGATPEIPQQFVARCGAFQGARSLGSH
jgi:cobyrinic acid a,c-diamide synthase